MEELISCDTNKSHYHNSENLNSQSALPTFSVIGCSGVGKTSLCLKFYKPNSTKNKLRIENSVHKSTLLGDSDPEKSKIQTKEEIIRNLTLVHHMIDSDKFTLIDTPGHHKYYRNFVRGIAFCQYSILVVSIDENEQNLKHFAKMLYATYFFGIKKLIVAVNKIELKNYSQVSFDKIVTNTSKILKQIGFNLDDQENVTFIPISTNEEDNLFNNSTNTPWYKGPSLKNLILNNNNKAENGILINPTFSIPQTNKPIMIVNDFFRGTKVFGFICRLAIPSFKQGDYVFIPRLNLNLQIKRIEFLFNSLNVMNDAGKDYSITFHKCPFKKEHLIAERGDLILKSSSNNAVEKLPQNIKIKYEESSKAEFRFIKLEFFKYPYLYLKMRLLKGSCNKGDILYVPNLNLQFEIKVIRPENPNMFPYLDRCTANEENYTFQTLVLNNPNLTKRSLFNVKDVYCNIDKNLIDINKSNYENLIGKDFKAEVKLICDYEKLRIKIKSRPHLVFQFGESSCVVKDMKNLEELTNEGKVNNLIFTLTAENIIYFDSENEECSNFIMLDSGNIVGLGKIICIC